MQYEFNDPATGGHFLLTTNDPHLHHNFFQEPQVRHLAIAWAGDSNKP
ncbi:MAG: hypothetical protein R2788_27320 [Saprospiraceae bacterium]